MVLHRQSVIHSWWNLRTPVLAQLGNPDMRGPSARHGYPGRGALRRDALRLSQIGSLTFEEPDLVKYPLLARAFEAIRASAPPP